MSTDRQAPRSEETEKAAAAWVFRRDAGLTSAEQAEFERWRNASPRHAAALTRYERSWSTLDRPRRAGQTESLLRRLAARAARRRRVGIIGIAGALLFMAGTIWQQLRPSVTDSRSDQGVVVAPATRTLPDGTVVVLKTGAEITVDFSGAWRRVALTKGEAHFQVAKQPRPFVVSAGTVDFRAVGTGFAVQVADTQVDLLVTEGRVAVEAAGDRLSLSPPSAAASLAGPPTSITVEAGSRIAVGLQATAQLTAPIEVSPAEMAERLAWRVPRLEFTETPLAAAVAQMNRFNRVQIVLADQELGRLPVSGLFRADRTEAMVRILEVNFGIVAEPEGETIRLRRQR